MDYFLFARHSASWMDYPNRVPEADIRGVSDDFGDK
jgi:hypothetical protein